MAIEAEKSPIVDIFVRFKDARELEENEDEGAETEMDRRRHRAEENVVERDVSVPTTKRAIRGRANLDSYADERMPAKRIAVQGTRYQRDSYNIKREPRSPTLSRREVRYRETMALVVRSRNRSRD